MHLDIHVLDCREHKERNGTHFVPSHTAVLHPVRAFSICRSQRWKKQTQPWLWPPSGRAMSDGIYLLSRTGCVNALQGIQFKLDGVSAIWPAEASGGTNGESIDGLHSGGQSAFREGRFQLPGWQMR